MFLPSIGFRIVVTIALLMALGGLITGVVIMLSLVYSSALIIGLGATLTCLSVILINVALLLR